MPGERRAPSSAKRKAIGTKKVNRWSKHVNETSDALDLQSGIFKASSPKTIARSLKRSAEASERRKGSPYQSAMSMLNFYLNRGGTQLSRERRATLEKAKDELKVLFGRE